MENQPQRNPRAHEAMEACRPGSDDLASPELQFLVAEFEADPQLEEHFHRLQQSDRVLASAMTDVPVPDDLQSRLLAALAVSPAIEAPAEPPPADAAQPAPREPARVSRRRLLRSWVALASGVAALVVAAGYWAWTGPPTYLYEAALGEAVQAFAHDLETVPPLEDLRTAPKGFPLSRHVLASTARGWRKARLLGVDGVAYDLSLPGGNRNIQATLYVVPGSVDGLRDKAPTRPRATGGLSSAAWQEDGLVCLLVVVGSEREYRSFLNLPRGPIT